MHRGSLQADVECVLVMWRQRYSFVLSSHWWLW